MFQLDLDKVKNKKKTNEYNVSGDVLDKIVESSGYGVSNEGEERLDKLSNALMNSGITTPSGNIIKPVPKLIDPGKACISPFNRRNQDNLDVSDLQPLIAQAGINLIPALVRPVKDGEFEYEVIYGSRRRKACFIENKPFLVLSADMSDEDALFFATEENMGSKDLSPFEWSEQYQLFIHSKTPLYSSIGELAKGIGFGRQYASKIYNLKTVPSELYSRIDRKNITVRKACLVKKLWEGIDSENKTSFLARLREESINSISIDVMIKKLSNLSSANLFESVKKEREFGTRGKTIITKTRASGATKIEFEVDGKLSDDLLRELEKIIERIDMNK